MEYESGREIGEMRNVYKILVANFEGKDEADWV
jgi:hypothetical protein